MKSRTGSIELKDILIMGVLIVLTVVGFLWYKSYSDKKAEVARIAAEAERAEREKAEREERDRKLREQEEFERKKREARLAKEKEEERRLAEERERKRRAAEAAAEQERKAEELRKLRTAFDDAKDRFKSVFGFSGDVPDSDKPRTTKEEKIFWCAFSSFPSEMKVYEVKTRSGGGMDVVAMSANAAPEAVDAAGFAERLRTERSATVTSSGQVFLTGVKPPTGYAFDLPRDGSDFRISEAILKDFYPAYVALEMRVPEVSFRVRLCSVNGKVNVGLGRYGYDEPIPRSKAEEAISRRVSGMARQRVSDKSNVKRRKLKRTAILYDGKYLKKDIKGVTMVPRKYEFIGTTNYKADDSRAEREFRAKWQKLYNRAVEEDRLEQKYEADYRAALAAEDMDRKRARDKAARAANDDNVIDAELSRCRFVIDTPRAMAGKQ